VMGDVIQFRPRQPDSARDYWRMMEQAFATFPVPTLASDEEYPTVKIFGDHEHLEEI